MLVTMEDAYSGQQSKHDHPGERNEHPGSLSSLYEDEEDDEASSSNSIGSSSSSSSDLMEDATSANLPSNGPLFEMSSLISQLPFKRGLSKHFEGKSQSFTSLSNVKSLEDLIKPERSFKNKRKPSKIHAWDLDKSLCLKKSSRAITKKSSIKGSFSSLVKKHNFLGSKSLFSPKRSGSISGQILVFAERSLETVG